MSLDKQLNKYYSQQLEKVSEPHYKAKIQITQTSGAKTNWLDLNDESANALVKYLKEHYNIKEG